MSEIKTVFVVLADGLNYSDLVVGAYDNQGSAAEHATFIDNVPNDWRGRVEWMPLRSDFVPDRSDALKDLKYLEW